MVRPLLEINRPWLTRDQAEYAIWRLSGLKDADTVEQLLRIMDIYAVSQGPALIQRVRDRDLSRQKWSTGMPEAPVTRLRVVEPPADDDSSDDSSSLSHDSAGPGASYDGIGVTAAEVISASHDGQPELAEEPPQPASVAGEPASATAELVPAPGLAQAGPAEPAEAPGRPEKAAQAWLMPDGSFTQRCSVCNSVKDYEEFHKSAIRWNGRASQCKVCKNSQRRGSYHSGTSRSAAVIGNRLQLHDDAGSRAERDSGIAQ